MQKIRDGTTTAVGGLGQIHKAHIIAAVRRFTGRPCVVVCADELACRRIASDITALSGEDVISLPYREPVFHHVESASRDWEILRLRAMYGLCVGTVPIVVTTPDALLLRTLPPDVLMSHAVFKIGMRLRGSCRKCLSRRDMRAATALKVSPHRAAVLSTSSRLHMLRRPRRLLRR